MIRCITLVSGCRYTYRGTYRRALVGIAVGAAALTVGDRLMAQQTVAAHTDGVDVRAADKLLARRVTVALMRMSLHQALDSIAIITKIPIQYGDALLARFTTPVTINAVDTPLGVVLERVLDGTTLRIVSDGQGELKVVATRALQADSVPHMSSVSGRIVDSTTGRGLAGATVKVAGTKLSAISGDSGMFTLSHVLNGTQVITVKLFGYRPTERTVDVADSGRTSVRIRMSAMPNVLSGVVTTATGAQRKIEVGNDITAINVDSVMRTAPITSVTDLLETRVPGLTVLHSSGVPGDPSRIRLRGASSINGNNDPIVIVDGVRVYASQSDSRNDNIAPTGGLESGGGNLAMIGNKNAAPSPLDQIDPNSIATIEVFKGPSASALYGSDAANGVIVITTKHGVAGPAHWTVDLGAGINYEPGQWPVNFYRFGYGQSSGSDGSPFCDWNDLSCTVDSIVPFQALNDPRYTVFASHGSDQTASLSMSGGSPSMTYNLTGSVAGDEGIFKLPEIEQVRYEKFYGAPPPSWMLRPDHYTTNSVSGQLHAQPAPSISVTVTSSLFTSQQQRSSLEGAIAQLEGIYVDPTQLGQSTLIANDVQRATDHQVTQTNALTLAWQPTSWLPLSATGGVNTIQRTDETLIPYGINSCSEGGLGEIGGRNCNIIDTTGYFGLGRGTSQDNTMNVGTTIPLPRVALAMGVNFHSGSTSDVTASTNQLSPGVTEPTTFPTTNGASVFSQNTSAASTYGFYIQPQIHVVGDFYLNPGFRTDGGSATGSNAGFTTFPKIDLSYAVVNRDDHPLWGALTLLRPRVAFGYAGVQPAPTDKLRLFSSGLGPTTVVSLDGTTLVPVVILSSLGNTQLRPERSSEVEAGFDASLWNNRVQSTFTRYNKTRHDAIISIPVPGSVFGGSDINKNIGEVQNSGTEITLDAVPIESRALSWNIGVTLSNNTNRVIRLNPGQPTIVLDDGTRIEAGYPLFGRWALPIVAYADANHDGVIEASEIRVGDSAVYVGQQDPKYQWTLNTGVAMDGGRFSVNATFAYQNGLTQFNAAGGPGFANLPNIPGTSLATQAAVVASNGYLVPNAEVTDIGLIQTVNIFRFQAMSVNYVLPTPVARLFRVPRMTMSVQGSNLGLHSNYRGKDPQVNAFSTGGRQAEDAGELPLPRTWWLKLSLGN